MNLKIPCTLSGLLLLAGCASNQITAVPCPGDSNDFYRDWLAYQDYVAEQGPDHRDYEVLFANKLEDSDRGYFINQCLGDIVEFKRGENKGGMESFEDWLTCLEAKFHSPYLPLVDDLHACGTFKY